MVNNIICHYYISLNPKYSELTFQEKKVNFVCSILSISTIYLFPEIIENNDNYKTLINEKDKKKLRKQF